MRALKYLECFFSQYNPDLQNPRTEPAPLLSAALFNVSTWRRIPDERFKEEVSRLHPWLVNYIFPNPSKKAVRFRWQRPTIISAPEIPDPEWEGTNFCVCNAKYSELDKLVGKNRLIQCTSCCQWYHYGCQGVTRTPDDDWNCKSCEKQLRSFVPCVNATRVHVERTVSFQTEEQRNRRQKSNTPKKQFLSLLTFYLEVLSPQLVSFLGSDNYNDFCRLATNFAPFSDTYDKVTHPSGFYLERESYLLVLCDVR